VALTQIIEVSAIILKCSAFISQLEEEPATHPVILHGCSIRVFLKIKQGR